MAGSDGSSGGASQLPKAIITMQGFKTLPRRKLTLISLTVCLNVLLWSSLCTLIVTLYLVAADPGDTTIIPTNILTLASCLTSSAYILVHTVFSLKQRAWKRQRRHQFIVKKRAYIAIRLAVTLCILWLLTSGWNMITAARQPVCLPEGSGLAGWEAGASCLASRVGFAMSWIALIASCTLFGMLAVVRRPFEAHLFKVGYRERTSWLPAPVVFRAPSPARDTFETCEKYSGRRSTSTDNSISSQGSTADADTINLDGQAANIHAPAPVRNIGLGIFTSEELPPPVPAAFLRPRSTSGSPVTPPADSKPAASYRYMPRPPRLSSLLNPSGFVPLSVPLQYSASAWKAVHPTIPSPPGPVALRPSSHLPYTSQAPSYLYRHRFSTSSVSLSRPHRLSGTPANVAWSSSSGSTSPDKRSKDSLDKNSRGSPVSTIDDPEAATAIAHAILNSTPIPDALLPPRKSAHHLRQHSAPDATAGAPMPSGRMGMGWKPQLHDQKVWFELRTSNLPRGPTTAGLQSSPDKADVGLKEVLETQIDLRLTLSTGFPFRKSRSASSLRIPDASTSATMTQLESTRKTPRNVSTPEFRKSSCAESRRDGCAPMMTLEESLNKPLPKIATL